MKNLCSIVIALFLALLAGSCDHSLRYDTSAVARLSFSSDTLCFDTLFSSTDSPTRHIMVYNHGAAPLRLSAYQAGGEKSDFKVNVDGESGFRFRDLEIGAGDSMWVFAAVSPSRVGKKQIRESVDSIVFLLEGGASQSLILSATVRDALMLRSRTFTSDTILTSYQPVVVYDTLLVAKGTTLTITEGTELFFHKNALLNVEGCILAQGSADMPVVMRSDRLELLFPYLPYDRVPGQWGGVHLLPESYGNEFNHCDIHGGDFAIKADSSDVSRLKLRVENSILHNVSGHVVQLENCRSVVENSQITNGGGSSLVIMGGIHQINFCTLASFYPYDTSSEAVMLANASNYSPLPLVEASFKGCIITGRHKSELVTLFNDTIPAAYSVSNTLLRMADTVGLPLVSVRLDTIQAQENFRVIDFQKYFFDFRPDSLSLARGVAGCELVGQFPLDLLGHVRSDTTAFAGAYTYP